MHTFMDRKQGVAPYPKQVPMSKQRPQGFPAVEITFLYYLAKSLKLTGINLTTALSQFLSYDGRTTR